MIPARNSIVTLGVQDITAMREFYRRLGWREEGDSDSHSMFHTGGGRLAIFPADDLASDANVQSSDVVGAYRGYALAINRSPEQTWAQPSRSCTLLV
jgi:uncharacterized protein